MRAWVIEKTGDGGGVARLGAFDEAGLMEGDVTVRVTHSALNYKDGLALTGRAPVVRRWPMVPGIDLAGVVEASDHGAFRPGDAVVLNGWGLGETHLGGYAERARVRGDWLVPLPEGMSAWEAMAVGTAGYTAMLALVALERHGLTPDRGPALVTGAAGGVGSVAVSLLARAGWHVVASTGRAEAEGDYLRGLGAAEVIARAELSEPSKRPLGRERWAAGVDSVGSHTLANALAATRYGGAVAACGLAGGMHGPARERRPLHPARRLAARRGQRDVPDAAPARGLDSARARPRPRGAGADDDDDPPRRGGGGRARDPRRAGARAHGGGDRLRDRPAPCATRSRRTGGTSSCAGDCGGRPTRRWTPSGGRR